MKVTLAQAKRFSRLPQEKLAIALWSEWVEDYLSTFYHRAVAQSIWTKVPINTSEYFTVAGEYFHKDTYLPTLTQSPKGYDTVRITPEIMDDLHKLKNFKSDILRPSMKLLLKVLEHTKCDVGLLMLYVPSIPWNKSDLTKGPYQVHKITDDRITNFFSKYPNETKKLKQLLASRILL